jgi:hypothetical protein
MNPYLTAARDRYAVIRGDIEGLQTRAVDEGRDLTAEELETVQRRGAEGLSLATSIEEMAAEQDRNDATNRLAAAVGGGAAVQVGGGGAPVDPFAMHGVSSLAPNLMPTRAQVAELHRAATEQRSVRVDVEQGDQHHRATVTMANAGDPVAGLPPVVPREPRRILTAGGIAVQRVEGITSAAFPVFGAGTAGIAAEGAVKPEYAAVTPGTATPQMISVWTTFTRHTLLSIGTFESRLRNKLAALVARREDQLVVAKVLGTAGIQTYAAGAADPYADTLLAAAGLVLSSDVAQAPNLAVIAPADVPKVFGGSVGRNGESPESELRLSLHGMDVYVSSAMTAGTALVGAWNVSSTVILGLPPTMFLDTMSGLKTNTITHLLEEAVDLAVDEPTGFVSVDFVTP